MALRIPTRKPEEENEEPQNIPVNRSAPAEPAPPPKPQPSAPPVPRELMSARPAMTKIRPRAPEAMKAANQQPAQPVPPKELTPEEEAERQQRIEYLKSLRKPDKKRRGGKKWLIIIIVLLLLIIAGLAGAYWFINRKPAPAKPAASSITNNTQTQQTQQPAADANFKDYTSTNFALGLKYPADWTLNDQAAELTIISPTEQLPGSAGSPVSGAVVFAVRPQQQSLPEFKTGNAVAVLDSKNVNYSSPAQGQRATTFLSYLQYNTTTTKGALDSIYITGNAGYKKTQTIPMADVIKVNPLINVYFVQCASNCTPTSTTTNVNAASWTSDQLNTTVETLLKSLSLN